MHKKLNKANINIMNGVVRSLKSTGVVRRIDELGRIVIPKEIRRNLGIKDGENVEIFTEEDYIILKKYYRMSTNSDLASTLCEIINSTFNYQIFITDREKVIAASGINPLLINKKINAELFEFIEQRENVIKEDEELKIDDISLNGYFTFTPIISLNDSVGLVVIYSPKKATEIINIGKLIANIFSRKLDI